MKKKLLWNDFSIYLFLHNNLMRLVLGHVFVDRTPVKTFEKNQEHVFKELEHFLFYM